jgi:hypothetical protein
LTGRGFKADRPAVRKLQMCVWRRKLAKYAQANPMPKPAAIIRRRGSYIRKAWKNAGFSSNGAGFPLMRCVISIDRARVTIS